MLQIFFAKEGQPLKGSSDIVKWPERASVLLLKQGSEQRCSLVENLFFPVLAIPDVPFSSDI